VPVQNICAHRTATTKPDSFVLKNKVSLFSNHFFILTFATLKVNAPLQSINSMIRHAKQNFSVKKDFKKLH